jgi:hypothetical protein
VVRRSASYRRIDTLEAEQGQFESVDEDLHHPNRVVISDEVVKALG